MPDLGQIENVLWSAREEFKLIALPSRQKVWISLVVLAFLRVPAYCFAESEASEGSYDLCFDATEVDLLAVAGWLPKNFRSIKRIFPIVFANGRTAFAMDSRIFHYAEMYDHNKDPLAVPIGVAGFQGIEVYPTIDMFRWAGAGSPERKDVFASHPNLLELDVTGSGGDRTRFASPWNPEVRKHLKSLVRQLAHRYRSARGIGLKAELSSERLLGYSEAARKAYISVAQVDPVKLQWGSENPQCEHWAQWRLDSIAEIVGKLSEIYRKERHMGLVIAFGYANAYKWDLWGRSRIGQDWLAWVRKGLIDDLVLLGDWSKAYNADSYSYAKYILAKSQKSVSARRFVKIIKDQGDLTTQISALHAQGYVPRVVIGIRNERDLEKLTSFLP